MYHGHGGVDIGAVVGEIGSYAARIGFAGEDSPKACIPSHVGIVGDDSMDIDGREAKVKRQYIFDLAQHVPSMEVKSPLHDGLIQDWDVVEAVWHHANASSLSADLSQTPVLLVEQPINTSALRQKYAELMFEKFQVPALFLSKSCVLNAFACGKTTALVVDVGAGTTTVAPVQDGWVEAKGVLKSRLGGRMMDRFLLSLMEKMGMKVLPFVALKRSQAQGATGGPKVEPAELRDWHISYREFAMLEVARDMKETVCRMPEAAFREADPRYASVPRVNYELPDGTVVACGLERFKVAELLMSSESAPNYDAAEGDGWCLDPLPKMAADAVFKCDRDQQSQLLANVVLAGGGACIDGTVDRLKVEVEAAIYGSTTQAQNRVKVVAAAPQERKYCAWLGGSIVASLGSFHEIWVSSKEYGEHGASIVDRKCP